MKQEKMSHEELVEMLEESFPDWPLEFGKISWLDWTDPEDKEWNKIYDAMIVYEILDGMN